MAAAIPYRYGAGKAKLGADQSVNNQVQRRREAFRAAAEAINRDPKAAAKMFDDIAADRSVGAEQQALARVRAAGLLLDTTSYGDMLQRLQGDAAPEATFRHAARELLALSAYRANDATAARQWLDMIALDGETPPSVRSRAEALQALLPPIAKS